MNPGDPDSYVLLLKGLADENNVSLTGGLSLMVHTPRRIVASCKVQWVSIDVEERVVEVHLNP
jgi:hypothetical protein